MNKPYNIFYDNTTGRVILQKKARSVTPNKNLVQNNDFDKK